MNIVSKGDQQTMTGNLSVNLNDKDVFDLLYRNYWTALLNFAGRYIDDHETCKEVVQELFISLHIKRDQLNINISLSSYLYSSLKNKMLNYIRNESLYKKHVAVAGKYYSNKMGNNDIEQLMDLNDLKQEIFNCLNSMPLKYREVYLLNKHNAYSLKMTACILQRPIDTVEKQLRKAVHRVQEHLNKRNMY